MEATRPSSVVLFSSALILYATFERSSPLLFFEGPAEILDEIGRVLDAHG
jgi:hypothetical protein